MILGEGITLQQASCCRLMRAFVIVVVVLLVLAGAVAAAYRPLLDYWEQQTMPKWKTAEVAEGEIVSVVNATGTIKPALQISVGAFVSGPIDPEYQLVDSEGNLLYDKSGRPMQVADFNQEVKKGDILAKIDPR